MKYWLLLIMNNCFKNPPESQVMICMISCGEKKKSKLEDLLKRQAEAKQPFSARPLPFTGLFNHRRPAGGFLVGNQTGEGQMLWQKVTSAVFN